MTSIEYHEYIGVIHIHSRYSDGSGSIKKIVKAAKESSLDYIIITDHNNIKAIRKGHEGWHDGVFVLVGEEVGKRRREHYLALGITEEIKPEIYRNNIQKYAQVVTAQNGFGFAAHPNSLHNSSFHINLEGWHSWDNVDYTGIEVWSYMHDWSKNINLLNILYYFIHPERAIDGPPSDLLEKWDQLCQKRRIVGIASSDAHARYLFPFKFMQFLSYKRTFKALRTHLLIQAQFRYDLSEDKELLYAALRSGHCFFAHDFLADSSGFSFGVYTDKGLCAIMGDEFILESPAWIKVSSPVSAKISLIKDGKKITEKADEMIMVIDDCGVYRVEAEYDSKPWVFTNPIYIRTGEGAVKSIK